MGIKIEKNKLFLTNNNIKYDLKIHSKINHLFRKILQLTLKILCYSQKTFNFETFEAKLDNRVVYLSKQEFLKWKSAHSYSKFSNNLSEDFRLSLQLLACKGRDLNLFERTHEKIFIDLLENVLKESKTAEEKNQTLDFIAKLCSNLHKTSQPNKLEILKKLMIKHCPNWFKEILKKSKGFSLKIKSTAALYKLISSTNSLHKQYNLKLFETMAMPNDLEYEKRRIEKLEAADKFAANAIEELPPLPTTFNSLKALIDMSERMSFDVRIAFEKMSLDLITTSDDSIFRDTLYHIYGSLKWKYLSQEEQHNSQLFLENLFVKANDKKKETLVEIIHRMPIMNWSPAITQKRFEYLCEAFITTNSR